MKFINLCFILIISSGQVWAQTQLTKNDEYEFFLSLKNSEALNPLSAHHSFAVEVAYDGRAVINASPFVADPWIKREQSCHDKSGEWVSRPLSKEQRKEFLTQFKISKQDKISRQPIFWQGEFSQTGLMDKFFWQEVPEYFSVLLKNLLSELTPQTVVMMNIKAVRKSAAIEITVSFNWIGKDPVLLHFPRYVGTSFEMPGHSLVYVNEPEKEVELGHKQNNYKVILHATPNIRVKAQENIKEHKRKKPQLTTARIRYHNNFSLKFLRNVANPKMARHLKISLCQEFNFR
jgi:hypothetical protein